MESISWGWGGTQRTAAFVAGGVGIAGLAAGAIFGVVALWWADGHVLPRLYPAFHWALGAVALLLGGVAGLALPALDAARPRRLFQGPVIRGAAAAAVFALGAARAPGAADANTNAAAASQRVGNRCVGNRCVGNK